VTPAVDATTSSESGRVDLPPPPPFSEQFVPIPANELKNDLPNAPPTEIAPAQTTLLMSQSTSQSSSLPSSTSARANAPAPTETTRKSFIVNPGSGFSVSLPNLDDQRILSKPGNVYAHFINTLLLSIYNTLFNCKLMTIFIK